MSDNALFACGNGYCELSHPAKDLRVWKSTPYCQGCYEDATEAEDEPIWFADLPPFVPPYERELAELTAERDRLREAASDVIESRTGGYKMTHKAALEKLILLLVTKEPAPAKPYSPTGPADPPGKCGGQVS